MNLCNYVCRSMISSEDSCYPWLGVKQMDNNEKFTDEELNEILHGAYEFIDDMLNKMSDEEVMMLYQLMNEDEADDEPGLVN